MHSTMGDDQAERRPAVQTRLPRLSSIKLFRDRAALAMMASSARPTASKASARLRNIMFAWGRNAAPCSLFGQCGKGFNRIRIARAQQILGPPHLRLQVERLERTTHYRISIDLVCARFRSCILGRLTASSPPQPPSRIISNDDAGYWPAALGE
jgi:hypothetical protein